MAENKENISKSEQAEHDRIESQEWMESLDYIISQRGRERVLEILRQLQNRAANSGIHLPYSANTPYINSIPRREQKAYPGSRELERRIKSIIRWNAMAMVVRANREKPGIGGHLSSYASGATLYEVAFNHFFRQKSGDDPADLVYFQGHSAPGIYSRAFLEGGLTEEHLKGFRQEASAEKSLSSYPHPWLMPEFWQFPTVSMGLGPVNAIYQARFNRYLEDRSLVEKTGKVWAFLGDGETDEPETLGALSLASRENLDNLIFVVNCNLQRLDGPVRGNGKIIQELEAVFRGAGWNVIKVIWGSGWDPLLEKDDKGLLVERMERAVDGEYQKYSVESGAYIRENFFGTDEELLNMVEGLSDEELRKLPRGGHDPEKVYAAYAKAVAHRGSPTVILVKTIKGYGLGESAEGKNVTHQQKKLKNEEIRKFRDRFGIPVSDDEIDELPFYRPPEDSAEMKYLKERREQLGGFIPRRSETAGPVDKYDTSVFDEFGDKIAGKEASTTMVYVKLLSQLLKDKTIGKIIVPIVPDEARTFGMEALFRQVGIYSHVGQKYEPVDRDTLLYYKEAKNGQILEEGITEAGSIASFIAAGTSYSNHGITTIPFFSFYSMFGFQRVGDQIWAAGDSRARGFLAGGTAGRTTLSGEGLQHNDGHSLQIAMAHPRIKAYDPATGYELATIIEHGIDEMYRQQKNYIYYFTMYNENTVMPGLPSHLKKNELKEKIIKGMYKFSSSELKKADGRVSFMASGPLFFEAMKARDILEKDFNIAVDLFSVTSYKQLYLDYLDCDRDNHINPDREAKQPYVAEELKDAGGPVIAVSDFMKSLPLTIDGYLDVPFIALGTDGFGRSDDRADLRRFFEIDAGTLVQRAGAALLRTSAISKEQYKKIASEYKPPEDKENPVYL